MGVPGLFAWFKRHYPDVVRDKTDGTNIFYTHEDCDHLYIDLNHILHACSHGLGLTPDDGPLSGIFGHIEKYIDKLIEVAMPRKLCLLAVDGVAPKAKLMQQRTRRFLGAHRKKLESQFGQKIKYKMERLSNKEFENPPSFDQNIITPGTPFMRQLSSLLHEYVDKRLKYSKEWKNLKVILSTASEPGEGEHKIIRFIKDQRRRPGYDPKTKHVIFGQDADLILLTLLTHEPHFRILRENLSKSKPHEIPDFSEMDIGRLRQRLKYGLDPFRDPEDEEETPVSEENVEDSDSAAGSETEKQDEIEPLAENEAQEENEIEPLPEKETESQPHPPDFDIERTLEDFVCLTFLLGNDFLPSIPSLDIYDRFGGLDRVVQAYKGIRKQFPTKFLTRDGSVDPEFFHRITKEVAKDELNAYRRIRRSVERQRERLEKEEEKKRYGEGLGKGVNIFERDGFVSLGEIPDGYAIDDALRNTLIDAREKEEIEQEELSQMSEEELAREYKRRLTEEIDRKLLEGSDADLSRLGRAGYEQRYYMAVGVARYEDAWGRASVEMGRAYFEGICWSFAYYTVGTNPVVTNDDSTLLIQRDADVSNQKKKSQKGKNAGPIVKTRFAAWDWCYPYAHAPLIKDISRSCREATLNGVFHQGIIKQKAEGLSFNKGPVTPFIQLLSVLPPESADVCLPRHLAKLLKATDRESIYSNELKEIVDPLRRLFPKDLARFVDPKGKIWAHTVVVKLPSVDYALISNAAREVSKNVVLSEEDEESNTLDCGDLYMRQELANKLKNDADRASKAGSEIRNDDEKERDDAEKPPRTDPILSIVIPPFEQLFQEMNEEVDAEAEYENFRSGCDIAGILLDPSSDPSSLLPGALENEEPIKSHMFVIEPHPADRIQSITTRNV